MNRPKLEVGDVFRRYGDAYRQQHAGSLSLAQLRVMSAQEDAERLGVRNGDAITLRNALGSFAGRVKIERIKPGCLQAHWPEANAVIPAGRFDSSGTPDEGSGATTFD